MKHVTNNLHHWSIGTTCTSPTAQGLRILCVSSCANHANPLINNSYNPMSTDDFAKTIICNFGLKTETQLCILMHEMWRKRLWKCAQSKATGYAMCREKHSLGSRGRHWWHDSVRLNSFSLTCKYFPTGAKKSSGQSSHSSNTSSDFILSFSYSPHRLHFLSVSSVKGCK